MSTRSLTSRAKVRARKPEPKRMLGMLQRGTVVSGWWPWYCGEGGRGEGKEGSGDMTNACFATKVYFKISVSTPVTPHWKVLRC